MKKRIFSGIQPSGTLHIGNYLGAIKNWVELQDKYDSIFCIVDLHALTIPQDPKKLKKNILETAAIYLAAGINPEKSIIFVQSHVPEHAELTWLLNTITKIPELERMTQFKDKSKKHRSKVNLGLFGYPVLMAADILLYQTDAVPVGQDQKQHVELSRALARRFNRLYNKTFTVPKVIIKKQGAKIMSLDNPLKKMSKSAVNPGKKIKYTDKKPAITNLMTIYHCFSGMSFDEIEKKYQSKGYAEFKNDLAKVIINGLKPFQKKKKALEKNPEQTKKILVKGAQQAQTIASKTLQDVKKKIGLL